MRTTTFEVELNMFCQGKIRPVQVPNRVLSGNVMVDLGKIFHYGQNEVQPLQMPSVSMGDVIRHNGNRWLILAIGFRKLKEGDITVGYIPAGR